MTEGVDYKKQSSNFRKGYPSISNGYGRMLCDAKKQSD